MKFFAVFKKHVPQEVKNIYHLIIAVFAVIYFRYPAKNLRVIGVTGTDGKTTTATLIYEFLKKGSNKVALVSTVSAYIGEEAIDTGFHVTAPESWLLQKLLKKIADKGYKYVVLEATSHGLDQHRLFGSNIKVAVLTNITHEHLDYHKTYEKYVAAKAKIFKGVELAIVNKADRSYNSVKKYIDTDVKVGAYDIDSPSVKIREAILSRFPENYNHANATAAYFVASYFGVSDDDVIKTLKSFVGVEGRMDEVKNDRGIRIIVDFAHTPNALENVLVALRHQVTKGGRLISVFGCASERDIDKRPMMGRISTKIADISVFTSEDPRNESPGKIINQIIVGAKRNKKPNKYYSIPDRSEAIDRVINTLSRKGDIIVICGKGHEKSMNIGGTEYPWSDKEEVLKALKKR